MYPKFSIVVFKIRVLINIVCVLNKSCQLANIFPVTCFRFVWLRYITPCLNMYYASCFVFCCLYVAVNSIYDNGK